MGPAKPAFLLGAQYPIYSNKRRGAYKFFVPRVRRLIEGDACLKIRRYTDIFSTVYLPSVRKQKDVTDLKRLFTFRYFSLVSAVNSDLTVPKYNITFLKKRHFRCGFRLSSIVV